MDDKLKSCSCTRAHVITRGRNKLQRTCMYVCMYVCKTLLTYLHLFILIPSYLHTCTMNVRTTRVHVHYYEYLHLLGILNVHYTMFYYVQNTKRSHLFFNSLTPPPPPQSSATDAPLLPLPSIFFLDPCIKVSEVNLVPRKKDSNADMVPSSIDLSECSAAWL